MMKAAGTIAFCTLFVLFCACDNRGEGSGEKEDAIKIGVYLPLTGTGSFVGQLELEGILPAHKERGEALGRRVELVIEDNRSDSPVAAEVVRKLITEDKVAAIIGTPGSYLALAGGDVAEILFMPAYFNEGVQILTQANAIDVKFMIMGGDAMDNPTTIALSKEIVEGFVHTAMPYGRNMPDMNQVARKFTAAWLAVYHEESNANAAMGYSAYQLILEGIGRARSTSPDAVVQALSGIRNLPGVMGPMTINASHDVEMPVGVVAYKNNRRAFLDIIHPGYEDGGRIKAQGPPGAYLRE